MVSLVRIELLAALLMMGVWGFPSAEVQAQQSNLSVASGFNIDNASQPFVDAQLRHTTHGESGTVTADFRSRLPLQNESGRFGSALLHGGLDLTKTLSRQLSFAAEVAYDFDRDVSAESAMALANIETRHDIGGGTGIVWRGEKLRIDADVAGTLSAYDKFEVVGLGTFDRGFRDHVDYELAVRLAYLNRSGVTPFVELAYAGRDYLDRNARNFSGPEFISGIEIEGSEFSGQIAAIVAHRQQADGDQHLLFGPYMDVSWSPTDQTEIMVAVGSSFAQESIGDPSVYEVLSGAISLSHQISGDFKLELKSDIIYEMEPGPGSTLTVEPSLRLTHTLRNLGDVYVNLSASFEREHDDPVESDLVLSVGFNRPF